MTTRSSKYESSSPQSPPPESMVDFLQNRIEAWSYGIIAGLWGIGGTGIVPPVRGGLFGMGGTGMDPPVLPDGG